MADKNISTLTKAELAQALSELGLSQRHSRQVVDYTFSLLSDALRRGEVVHLVGFGSFHFKQRRPRKGRNPKTGESVMVPAKTVIHFRPGNWLKNLVRD